MGLQLNQAWRMQLLEMLKQPYCSALRCFLDEAYATQTIYPPQEKVFAAFEHCSFEQVKVVLLGQDPYHGVGQANGLSFSVAEGVALPPSLQNIFKELKADLGIEKTSGDLSSWASQGVLLLNATLTVQAKTPGSHQNKGWEQFTDAVIQKLSEEKTQLVFLLWGAYAQRKGAVINRTKHLVLESPHPSPFSAHRGFLGNRHFSKTNAYLVEKGKEPINW